MKVERNNCISKNIEDLLYGECFMYSNDFFVKVEVYDDFIKQNSERPVVYAVNFTTNALEKIYVHTVVDVVNAKIVIE